MSRHSRNRDTVPFEAGPIKDAYEGGGVDKGKFLTPKYKTEMLKRALFLRTVAHVL